MSWKGGSGFEYFGKPSADVARKVQKILRSNVKGEYTVAEVDRLGAIVGSNGLLPYDRSSSDLAPIRTSALSNRFWFYHPGNTRSVSVLTWMLHSWWTKRIKLEDKIYTVYCEREKLSSEFLRTTKDWIRSSGVLNG